jgi:predicted nucleic acid-binding protein
MLRYAWGTAPDLSELIDTLAQAARDFKPIESGFIGAAIESRQRSEKTEYLRAFGNLFTDAHHLKVSIAVMQAMAVVANVVINLPDVDVTYDDVRKALAKLGGERLENAHEK